MLYVYADVFSCKLNCVKVLVLLDGKGVGDCVLAEHLIDRIFFESAMMLSLPSGFCMESEISLTIRMRFQTTRPYLPTTFFIVYCISGSKEIIFNTVFFTIGCYT